MEIQEQMTERAIELLVLPEDTPCFILDIGCGSGLSGSVLEDNGHYWVGMDISTAMLGMYIISCKYWYLSVVNQALKAKISFYLPLFLDVAVDREVEGDLVLSDMGQGCPFKAGKFNKYCL